MSFAAWRRNPAPARWRWLERSAGASNKAPAKISALVARSDSLRLPANVCVMTAPFDAHHV